MTRLHNSYSDEEEEEEEDELSRVVLMVSRLALKPMTRARMRFVLALI